MSFSGNRLRLSTWFAGIVLCAGLMAAPLRGDDPPKKTYEVVAKELKLTIPESWKQEPPSNNLRFAQFAIPAAEGDTVGAEMVVSLGFGGSRDANIDRWISQFVADGRKAKVTVGKAEQGEYVFVDVSGTYNLPDGPPVLGRTKPTPGYRMLGVIITSKNGNDFLKLTGPGKTVEGNVGDFRASFGGKAEEEKPYEK